MASQWSRKSAYVLVSAAILAAALLGASAAWSYSVSNTQFYDGLSDLSAFDASATAGVSLDPLGGLRLSTTGTENVSEWTTVADFRGLNATSAGPVVGTATLEATPTSGGSGSGSLRLIATPLALSFNEANPVVSPSFDTSTDAGDSFEVAGPSVIKVGNEYRMFYSGVAPDGYTQRIFEATSTLGVNVWNKVRGPGYGGAIVDIGEPDAFDGRGLVRPAAQLVVATSTVDSSTVTTTTVIYYGALSDEAGYIGSASSTDNATWTKYTETTGVPSPALSPGLPGMQDGFSVGEPTVVYDPVSKVFRMWYVMTPGPDVAGRAVGYAASTNTTADAFGGRWGKGGAILMNGANGNWKEGWFSPGVFLDRYMSGSPAFGMAFAGLGNVGQPYKILSTDLSDAKVTIDPTNFWYGGVLAQSTGTWDYNNVFWPSVVKNAAGANYGIYYTGNGPTDDEKARSAIGLSTWSGSGQGAEYAGNPVLQASAPSQRFDAMFAANGSLVRSVDSSGNPQWLMLYAGRSAKDLLWRVGAAVSTDGAVWAKVDTGTADATRKSVIPLGGGGAFDASGTQYPSVIALDSGGNTLAAVYQGTSNTGVHAFGVATATASSVGSWTCRPGAILTVGGTSWSTDDISHPSVIASGSAWRIYYAGKDSGDVWRIGYATATGLTGPWSKVATAAIQPGGAGEFDAGGALDPVVVHDEAASVFRMWYTARDGSGIDRIALADSTNGVTWRKQGLAACPSERPYKFDEIAVRPSGAAWDTANNQWRVLFDGLDRGNTALSLDTPDIRWLRIGDLTGSGAGYLPDGSAAYQCDPTGTPAPGYFYEFRGFDWDSVVPTGTTARVYVSFYPAYTPPAGSPPDTWSKYFSIDASASMYLPLTTQRVRWRVAFTRDGQSTAQSPDLSAFRITWRPVHFEETGTALSMPIEPSAGRYIQSWQQLNVTADKLSQNASLTVTVLADDGQVLLGPTPVNTNGLNQVSLTDLPDGIPTIRVRFDFSGDGDATAYVKNWSVDYTTTDHGPVRDFRTMSHDGSAVDMWWTQPDYDTYSRTVILSREDTFPGRPDIDTTATRVVDATGTPGAFESMTLTGLTKGKIYYYTAWTTDETSATWSPPSYAIGVPADPLTNLTAAKSGTSANLNWSNGTTPTVPPGGWAGSRVLRAVGDTEAVTSPYDTTATVVGDFMSHPALDGGPIAGVTNRYGAWEHYWAFRGVRAVSTYSRGATAALGSSSVPDLGGAKVERIAGSDRYAVAINIAKRGYGDAPNQLLPYSNCRWTNVKHAIIACGEDKAAADPLAAAGLAGVYDAPVFLVKSTGIPTGVTAALKAIKAANGSVKIHIVGGTASVPSSLQSALSKIGATDRINGATRYDVTALIADRMNTELAKTGETIPGALIICSENPAAFFDALAASPASYSKNMPMLGVKTTGITSSVATRLKGAYLNGKPRYIVSSRTFISDTVKNTVDNYGVTVRLTTSTNRYTAATNIANAAYDNSWLEKSEVGIASKLPDSLTGGSFMGARNGMLLFTDTSNSIQTPTKNWILANKTSITKAWIFGGTASVTSGAQTALGKLLQ